GVASGVNNAVSRLAGVLALAILAVVASAVFSSALDGRMAALQLPPEVRQTMAAQRTKLAAAEIPASVDAGTAAALREAIAASFVGSFRVIMLTGAGLALGASACALVTIRNEDVSRSEIESH